MWATCVPKTEQKVSWNDSLVKEIKITPSEQTPSGFWKVMTVLGLYQKYTFNVLMTVLGLLPLWSFTVQHYSAMQFQTNCQEEQNFYPTYLPVL